MDGRTLNFDLGGGVAGLNTGLNFTMRDRETQSLWHQATGEAFLGPLKGKRLTIVPFEITTWGEWRVQHPDTLALALESRYQDQYRRMAERVAGLRAAATPERAPLRDDPRLPPHEQVVGIETRDGHKAYPLALVGKQTALNDQVGSTPVLLIHSTAGDSITAFSRRLHGRTLTFRAAKPGAADVVDNETASTWTRYGESVAGTLKGEKLESMTPLPSFWFAWAEYFPDTEVYSAGVR